MEFDSESSESQLQDDEHHISNSQVVMYVNHSEQTGRQKLREKARSMIGGINSFASVMIDGGSAAELQTVSKTLAYSAQTLGMTPAVIQTTNINAKEKSCPTFTTEKSNPTFTKENSDTSKPEIPSPGKLPQLEVPGTPPTRRTYRFLLSNVDSTQRENFCAMITKLHGQFSEDFGTSVTHVITPAASASPKCLATVASGKWLLKDKYLEDSVRAGYFLGEEEYEWTETPKQQLKDFVASIRGCRMYLERQRHAGLNVTGIFSGWVVVCLADQAAELNWRMVLEAGLLNNPMAYITISGGAKYVNLSVPFTDEDLEVRKFHCHQLSIFLGTWNHTCFDGSQEVSRICDKGTKRGSYSEGKPSLFVHRSCQGVPHLRGFC